MNRVLPFSLKHVLAVVAIVGLLVVVGLVLASFSSISPVEAAAGSLVAKPNSGKVPLRVNFSSNYKPGSDWKQRTFTINYGDKTSASASVICSAAPSGTGPGCSLVIPAHVYKNSGLFTAKLTMAYDPCAQTGCMAPAQLTVIGTARVTAVFEVPIGEL